MLRFGMRETNTSDAERSATEPRDVGGDKSAVFGPPAKKFSCKISRRVTFSLSVSPPPQDPS